MEDHLTCKIIMESKLEAEMLVKNLFNEEIFDHKIDAKISPFNAEEEESPSELEMEDGSRSCKKFLTDQLLMPDKVVAPTKVKLVRLDFNCLTFVILRFCLFMALKQLLKGSNL